MQKNFYLFLISSLLFLTIAEATQIQHQGTAFVNLDLFGKPSSREGNTAFSVPWLYSDWNFQIDPKTQFHWRLSGVEERSSQTHHFIVQLDRSYIEYQNNDSEYFKMGLVESPWLLWMDQSFDTDLFPSSSWTMTRKMKYVADSDLGLVWSKNFNFGAQLQLAVMNGEENRNEEKGAKKDFEIVYDQQFETNTFGFGIIAGTYEEYSPYSDKLRILIRDSFKWGCSVFGFEGVWARDPADAVSDLKFAEGVELSADLPGQKTTAVGGSVWVMYQLNDLESLLLKYDELNPSTEVAGKKLQGGQLAWSKKWTDSLNSSVFYDRLTKGPEHSKTGRDAEKIGLALRIRF